MNSVQKISKNINLTLLLTSILFSVLFGKLAFSLPFEASEQPTKAGEHQTEVSEYLTKASSTEQVKTATWPGLMPRLVSAQSETTDTPETTDTAETPADELLVEMVSRGGMQIVVPREVTSRFQRVGSSTVLAADFSVWEDGVLYERTLSEDGELSVSVDMPRANETSTITSTIEETLASANSNATAQPNATNNSNSTTNSNPNPSRKYLTPEEQAAIDGMLDWHTLFFYDYESRNLALYDAVTVRISNPNAEALSVNLVMENNESEADAIDNLRQPVIQPTHLWISADGQTTFEVLVMDGNRFEIPAGFSGYLYLPLAMYGAEGSNPFIWSDTIGLSAHFPAETGQHLFKIGNIRLLRDSISNTGELLQTPSLTGKLNLLLPKTGSMLEVYQASPETLAQGRPIEFGLAKNYEGVSVSPEGLLELEAAKITVDSIILDIRDQASGTFNRQVIQLMPLTELNPALADLSIPLPTEIDSFKTDEFDGWHQNLPYLRLAAGLGAFTMIGFFVYWWETERRYRIENHRQLRAKRGEK